MQTKLTETGKLLDPQGKLISSGMVTPAYTGLQP